MRKEQIKLGMKLWTWTSLYGEFIIIVREIILSKPARIRGEIIKIIKPPYKGRKQPNIGQVIEVGIINVKPYNGE